MTKRIEGRSAMLWDILNWKKPMNTTNRPLIALATFATAGHAEVAATPSDKSVADDYNAIFHH